MDTTPALPSPPTLGPVARPDEPHDLTAIRAWARSRGYPVDESPRLPLQVLRTYRRVHGG